MQNRTWADKVRDFFFPNRDRKTELAKESQIDPVPLHRSYGVRKREGFFAHLNNALAPALAIVMILVFVITWVLGSVMLIFVLGNIGVMIAITAVILFVYFKLCRKIRKRIKFIYKLKKRCKQLGLKLEFKRGLLRGLKFNTEGLDFIVDSPQKRWCVRFYTPEKYLSHLTFINKDTIEIKTNITESRLKFVLGLNTPKTKRKAFSFDDNVAVENKKTAKALILNPVPHDVFKKDPDGATIPIGTGAYLYGYIMFSGSGFLETLKRENEQ